MPQTKLVQCGHCHRFIEADEKHCPFCSNERQLVAWTSKLVVSAFAGFALVAIPGCPEEDDCASASADEQLGQGETTAGANGIGADCPEPEEGGEGGSDYAGPPIFLFA